MKIAVIGGGVTGLTAAYKLAGNGHSVTLFEKDPVLGGLAYGFRAPGWEWPLEFTYHHFFTNDNSLISLTKELGLENDLIVKRPITASLIPLLFPPTEPEKQKYEISQLDSPISLLRFNHLPLPDRLRTGIMLGFCKVDPFWQPLEYITAKNFIRTFGGENAWKIIWEPLIYGKFNKYADRVAASWFWARIRKRTANLGYIRGGFQHLVERMAQKIKSHRGKILVNTDISRIIHSVSKKPDNISGSQYLIHDKIYDQVLLTVPTPIALKLLRPLLTNNLSLTTYHHIPHLYAQMLILETNKPVLKDIYWLNINDRSFPFLAAVAHTNFMDKDHYGGHHLTYFGNYLPDGHPYLKMTKEQLIGKFLPFIQKLNPIFNFKLSTFNSYLFTGMYAQPVHELHYSQIAPGLETGIPGIYIANMDSIFPWDRGINYAVEMGQKAANKISGSSF